MITSSTKVKSFVEDFLYRKSKFMTLKKTINADIITPILAYLRLELKHKLILESIPREKENSRYSMIAYNPVHEIKFENGVLTDNGQVKTGDPLDYLGELTVKNTEASSLPFTGGAILGDRVRMQDHATDRGVFIRSMATRGHLGGLSLAAPEAWRRSRSATTG